MRCDVECNRIEGGALKHIANHLADVGRFLISPQLHRKCLPNSGEKGRAIPFFYPSVLEITTHPFHTLTPQGDSN